VIQALTAAATTYEKRKPTMMTKRNTVPKLVTTLRLNMGDIAGWTQMSTSMIQKWQAGAYQPRAEERDRLIAHVRDHAVESERPKGD
jgi:hypothetical protein